MAEKKTSPFDANPEIAAMRQDIADRAYGIKLKGMLITGGLALAGIGAMFLIPGGAPLLSVAMLAGSGVSALFTMKEQEKLEVDRQQLESRIQGGNWGKGHWSGYREEVMEKGGSGLPPEAMASTGGKPRGAGSSGRRST
ncbi:MAG: hypothetical protein EBX37_18240 [Alphaproteobacteria bacterium]|nr:hypothetical protein [Alphaproteobacteria bacterium]